MTHFFAVDPNERLAIVLRGRRVQQVFLLFHRSELSVALINNQIHQRVANRLVGNLSYPFPFSLSPEVAKLDLGSVKFAQFGFEIVVAQKRRIIADIFLPFAEVVDPVIKSRDFFHGFVPFAEAVRTIVRTISTFTVFSLGSQPNGTFPTVPPCLIRASVQTNTFLSPRRCPFAGRFAPPIWRLR